MGLSIEGSGLGERCQNVAISLHDFSRDRHLMVEIIGLIVGNFGQLNTTCHTGRNKLIANNRTEMVEDLLGQDDPGRIANLGDFERSDHTSVVTRIVLESHRG